MSLNIILLKGIPQIGYHWLSCFLATLYQAITWTNNDLLSTVPNKKSFEETLPPSV